MFAMAFHLAVLGLMVRHLAISGHASKKLAVSSPSGEVDPKML